MKKIFAALLCAAVLCSLCGCGTAEEPAQTKGVVVTDIFGDSAVLNAESRVAFGYTSFAQCWQLAGGEPLGVTLDAVEDRGMDLPEEVEIIGTVKSVDLEKLIALSPDYVVLSADLTAHTELKDSLREMGIPCGYFRVDTFDDYKSASSRLFHRGKSQNRRQSGRADSQGIPHGKHCGQEPLSPGRAEYGADHPGGSPLYLCHHHGG